MSAAGRVYVIGAGPGSPDLISLRGWRALLSADAVLADRLLPRDFLEQLGIPAADKTVQWLGEDHPSDGARPRWSQDAINRWLVLHARRGETVARLKGGDRLSSVAATMRPGPLRSTASRGRSSRGRVPVRPCPRRPGSL